MASEEIFKATALDYAFARQSLAATVAKSWYLAVETVRLQGLAEQAVRIYGLLQNRAKLIQLRYAFLANRINLHLALGGSFDAAPASVIVNK